MSTPSLKKSQIWLVIAPIGNGKTTLSNQIAAISESMIHLDGDKLPGLEEYTMISGGERGNITKYALIKALLDGKTPIYSGGGGVLFNFGKFFNLRAEIESLLGVQLEICMVVPGGSDGSDTVTRLTTLPDFDKIYGDHESVKAAVRRRLSAGEWSKGGFKTDDEFVNFICKKSESNKFFAKKLYDEADHVFGFPSVTSDDFVDNLYVSKIDMSCLADVVADNQKLSTINCMWAGLLVKTSTQPKLGHITCGYSKDRSLVLNSEGIESLSQVYGDRDLPGYEVTLTADSVDNNKNKKKKQITFAVLDYSVDLNPHYSSHVTIKPGNHANVQIKYAAAAFNRWIAFNAAVKAAKDGDDLDETIKTVKKYLNICQATLMVHNPNNLDFDVDGFDGVDDVSEIVDKLTTVVMHESLFLVDKNGGTVEYSLSAKTVDCSVKVLGSYVY